jgi:hypothetical protein
MFNQNQLQQLNNKLNQLLSSSSSVGIIPAPKNLNENQSFNYQGKQIKALNSCTKGSGLLILQDTETGQFYCIAEEGSKRNNEIISQRKVLSRHTQPTTAYPQGLTLIGNILPNFLDDIIPTSITEAQNISNINYEELRVLSLTPARKVFSKFEFYESKAKKSFTKKHSLEPNSLLYSDKTLAEKEHQVDTAKGVVGYRYEGKYEFIIEDDFGGSIYYIFNESPDTDTLFSVTTKTRPKKYDLTLGVPFSLNRETINAENSFEYEAIYPFFDSDILGLTLFTGNHPNQSIRYIWRVVSLTDKENERGQILAEGYVDRDGIFRGAYELHPAVQINIASSITVDINPESLWRTTTIDSNALSESNTSWDLSTYLQAGAIANPVEGSKFYIDMNGLAVGFGSVNADGSLSFDPGGDTFLEPDGVTFNNESAFTYTDSYDLVIAEPEQEGVIEMQVGYLVLGQKIIEETDTEITVSLNQYYPSTNTTEEILEVTYDQVTLTK